MNNFGARIKEERERKGLTQKELADAIGMNYQSISAIENNNRALKADELLKISKCLNIHISSLLGEKETETEFRWSNCMDINKCKETEDELIGLCGNYDRLQNIRGLKTKKFSPPKIEEVNWESYYHYFNFAVDLANRFRGKWQLSRYPADVLLSTLENEGILVFCMDLKDIAESGVVVGDFGSAIVINKCNDPAYDYFNICRELFNLLTWEVQPKFKTEESEFEKGSNTFTYHFLVQDEVIMEESSKILNYRGGNIFMADLIQVVAKFKIPTLELINDERVTGHLLIPSIQGRKGKGIYSNLEAIIEDRSELIDTLAGIKKRRIKELPSLYVFKALKAFQLKEISANELDMMLQTDNMENFLRKYLEINEETKFELKDLKWKI